MREILTEVIELMGGDKIEAIKVTGTEAGTTLQALREDKSLALTATLNEPLAGFTGVAGLTNLKLLSGLLDFPSYKTETAKITVQRKPNRSGEEAACAIDFVGSGRAKAQLRLMSSDSIPEQPAVSDVPWEVTISPDKGKVREFSALSRLYKEIDKAFTVSTDGGDLIFSVGGESAATHSAAMAFAHNVDGELSNSLSFPLDQFEWLMKLANDKEAALQITGKGLLGVTIAGKYGVYDYFLRAQR